MKKFILFIFSIFTLFSITANSFADDYILYYGEGCPHCAKVENFIDKYNLKNKIEYREIWSDRQNIPKYLKDVESFGLESSEVGVPFFVINGVKRIFLSGDRDIIDYLDENLVPKIPITEAPVAEKNNIETQSTTPNSSENKNLKKQKSFIDFLPVLLVAALSDSINPCVFAIMLILLTSVLIEQKKRSRIFLVGSMFILAIFLSYIAMGLGLYKAFASAENITILKFIVGTLGVIVGILNIKDYFWYGKGFLTEVPKSWRPIMKEFLSSVTSPFGAFLVGVIVSLFLLPCTSGPYITVLGYLASENKEISMTTYIYLILYNLVFILPMILIMVVIGFGFKKVEDLEKIRNNNIRLIHLIVGILMLGLGIYVFGELYSWWG